MPLINCDNSLIVTWSSTCIITNSTGAGAFETTDTKILCSGCNFINFFIAKLLQRLKSGFKRTINWNKYLLKISIERENPYLDYLIN